MGIKNIRLTQNEAEEKSLAVGIKMIGQYKNNQIKIEFECPFCKIIFLTQPANIWTKHTKSCGCQIGITRKEIPKNGNSLADKYPESLKYWDYDKNYPKTPYNVNFCTHSKYWMKCNNNNPHSYLTRCDNLISGNKCGICGGHQIHVGFNDLLSQQPNIAQEWDYIKNEKGPKEYTVGSHIKVWWQCKKCNNEWLSSIANRTNPYCLRGCPKCSESKGEKRITEILDKYNILYKRQKRFKDCKNKLPLPFDFYLPTYNTCIEYQGQQHYKSINSAHYTDEETLKNTQYHDTIKKQYCEDNNIKLIIIPYWDKNNIENILINAFDLVEQH